MTEIEELVKRARDYEYANEFDAELGFALADALEAQADAVDGDAQTMDDVLRDAEERILRISEKHDGHMKSAHTGVAKALATLRSTLR